MMETLSSCAMHGGGYATEVSRVRELIPPDIWRKGLQIVFGVTNGPRFWRKLERFIPSFRDCVSGIDLQLQLQYASHVQTYVVLARAASSNLDTFVLLHS